MIMDIVIALFVILAIWFVVGMVLDRPRNNPAAISDSLKFEIENNLVRIAKENKEIADMHSRLQKNPAESQSFTPNILTTSTSARCAYPQFEEFQSKLGR